MHPCDFTLRLALTFLFFALVAGGLGSVAAGAIPTAETFEWNAGFSFAAIFLVLMGISLFFFVIFLIWLGDRD